MHESVGDMKKMNSHTGSLLDDFLKEEGILEETRDAALKEVLVWLVQNSIKKIELD